MINALEGDVVGTLVITAGEVVVSDAGTLENGTRVALPAGLYTARLALADGRPRAATLVREGTAPTSFTEAGRYGVDTGTAGIFDASLFDALRDHVFEENLYEDLVAPALATHPGRIVAFEDASFFACVSGLGDGVYPVFVGVDATGVVVAVVTTF